MKILFTSTRDELIFTIDLNLTTRLVEKVQIEEYREEIAKIYYPKIKTPSYDSLELLFNDYLDTNEVPLPKLLAHIKEKGFYTPYKPNLRIKIEQNLLKETIKKEQRRNGKNLDSLEELLNHYLDTTDVPLPELLTYIQEKGDKKMKVKLFTNDLPVAEFKLDMNKKIISDIQIQKLRMAKVYFFNIERLTCDELHENLKKYMGGDLTLEGYINHIIQYGFYTPYKPNLRIKIEQNFNHCFKLLILLVIHMIYSL